MIHHKTTMRWDWKASEWKHVGWRMGHVVASPLPGKFHPSLIGSHWKAPFLARG
ncbi:hypothetical protein LF41_2420 [Lysobacter dokdonensis DS-58]|uniref:Uncharacterized protein n=1 Tax=Lysobacter dokdonensis DS-58 TaxID=1300345 RepID=A0A0A2WJB5_9GAMM|nr:hypothetical protein LF41_2420 [Lysobacter dokdonensis DS-58]